MTTTLYPTTLYHVTSEARAAAILEGGFRAPGSGLVWLSSGRLTGNMMTGEHFYEACVAVTVPPDTIHRYAYRRMMRYTPNPLWEPRRQAAGAAHCPYTCCTVPVDLVNTWPRRLHDEPDVPLSDEARAKAAAFDAAFPTPQTYWKWLKANQSQHS